MTNYNDGKWHGWNGGECPVHPETVVEVVTLTLDDGGIRTGLGAVPAIRYTWSNEGHYNPIIAFRVIKEHREPRELFAKQSFPGAWVEVPSHVPGAVLFREVLE